MPRCNLHLFNDCTPVALTEEERTEARKTLIKIRELAQYGLMLVGTEESGQLNRNAVHSLMGLNSSYHAELAKLLKYEDVLAQEEKIKYQEIREANLRIRELEEQLGQGVSGESVSCALQMAGKKFYRWHKKMGFQYIADVTISEYGILSGRVTSSLNKNAPAELVRGNGDESMEMVDTDANRTLLNNIFCSTFPGATIVKFETRRDFRDKSKSAFLLGAEVRIPLEEIMKLEEE